MSEKTPQLDRLDRQILTILMSDADASLLEIAQACGVSGSVVTTRKQKLDRLGITKSKHIRVDAEKVGLETHVFTMLYTEPDADITQLCTELRAHEAITEAHYTSGINSVLYDCFCADTSSLEALNAEVANLPGVARMDTLSVTQTVVRRPIDLLSS